MGRSQQNLFDEDSYNLALDVLGDLQAQHVRLLCAALDERILLLEQNAPSEHKAFAAKETVVGSNIRVYLEPSTSPASPKERSRARGTQQRMLLEQGSCGEGTCTSEVRISFSGYTPTTERSIPLSFHLAHVVPYIRADAS